MAKKKQKRKHKVGGSRKMPDHVLAHFAAKTLLLIKKRGIEPQLLKKRR